MNSFSIDAVVLNLKHRFLGWWFQKRDTLEFDCQPHVMGELGRRKEGVQALVGLDVEEVGTEEEVGSDFVHDDLVAEAGFVGE